MWGVKVKEAEEKTNQKRENIHVRRKSPVCWKSVSDRKCALVTYAMVCEFNWKEYGIHFPELLLSNKRPEFGICLESLTDRGCFRATNAIVCEIDKSEGGIGFQSFDDRQCTLITYMIVS